MATSAASTSAPPSRPSTQLGVGGGISVVVPRSIQLDFDKEEKKIQQLESTNKKFYKDVKTYVDKIDELNKSESKLINNLTHIATFNDEHTASTSPPPPAPPSLIETDEFVTKLKQWKDLLNEHNSSCESLKQACQQQVIEPMKKLNLLFPQVYDAIKRRQHAYNELTKQQAKLEKALEKERTGQQMVRNEQLKQQVTYAKQQFDHEHSLLMEQLPKLYNSRVDYIRPCVQALLHSQSNFYDNYTAFYESILKSNQTLNNDCKDNTNDIIFSDDNNNNTSNTSNDDDEIQKCLNEIKSLSIVAGD